MQISLKRFDPKKIEDTRIICIIARRGTGKTTLVKDLMYHKRHLDCGLVISGTEEGNKFYQKFVPDLFVYNEFDPSTLQKILDRQKELRKKGRQDKCFLVLDDCMYDKKTFKAKVVRQLFYNGRHYGVLTLMTNQYAMDLQPDLRSNIDYVFILKDNIRANRERLWKAFGGIFQTFEQFNAVMDQTTADYGCLVIDQTSTSNNIEDVAFWYKADPSKRFKMGGSALWRFHERKYNQDHEDESQGQKNQVKKKHHVSCL